MTIETALDGRPSTKQEFLGRDGRWDEQRLNQQLELLDDLWVQRNPLAQADGIAVVGGGMPGAGKTCVLHDPAVINDDDYCFVDPDEIKEAMAARGMIPAIDGLSPMEASELVHEEASDLAKQLARRLYRERLNLVWDVTMRTPKSVTDRRSVLTTYGYSEVDAIFVDVPFAVGSRRATDRYREKQEEFWNGDGWGGRYMPMDVMQLSEPLTDGETSRNHETFLQVRDVFDSTAEYDNSESAHVLRNVTGPKWR